MPPWNAGRTYVVSSKRGSRVRSDESLDSALVCVLPPGCVVVAVPFHGAAAATRMPVTSPVRGWLSSKTVVEAPPAAEGDGGVVAALGALLGVMEAVRDEVVERAADGVPLDQCFTSSQALVEALRGQALIAARLGRADMVSGSYDAVGTSKGRPSWWPSDYVDWMPHSFVQFEDGTLADVSADQFDVDLPRLHLIPASAAGGPEHARYAFTKDESKAARRMRFMFRQPPPRLSSDAWLAMVKAEPSHSDVAMRAWARKRMPLFAAERAAARSGSSS